MQTEQQQQQEAPTFLSLIEDIQHDPSSSSSLWHNTINKHEEIHRKRPFYRYYKRFVNDLLLPERQRRFGNTKYGRSISNQ